MTAATWSSFFLPPLPLLLIRSLVFPLCVQPLWLLVPIFGVFTVSGALDAHKEINIAHYDQHKTCKSVSYSTLQLKIPSNLH